MKGLFGVALCSLIGPFLILTYLSFKELPKDGNGDGGSGDTK